MTAGLFTIVDDGRATEVRATRADGRVRIDADAVERALGWELTDDGLCREGLCVPAPPAWSPAGGVALDELATVLGRPLALDADERVAWLGGAADERARTLRALTAPDFALADLDGRVHRLAEHRGTKVLLVVWASW
ncbi:MAG: hypothetical protein HYR51_05205 [Candidatus Rokubacteria bacterium]|nr:hypothetical protein [Candidatus Rokubacteria bacterium]